MEIQRCPALPTLVVPQTARTISGAPASLTFHVFEKFCTNLKSQNSEDEVDVLPSVESLQTLLDSLRDLFASDDDPALPPDHTKLFNSLYTLLECELYQPSWAAHR